MMQVSHADPFEAHVRAFWEAHPRAQAPLALWRERVAAANRQSPADLKRDFVAADFVAGNRVIFNIGGNKYRLVAFVSYRSRQVMIKFIGTHAEYDGIDPGRI